MTFYEDLYGEYVSNNKSTVEIYETIKVNNKVWLEDIFLNVMARLKYNINVSNMEENDNKNDKVLELLDLEYNKTKDEKLYQIINHLKKYNEERKLRIQKYREEEKFKEENPTP